MKKTVQGNDRVPFQFYMPGIWHQGLDRAAVEKSTTKAAIIKDLLYNYLRSRKLLPDDYENQQQLEFKKPKRKRGMIKDV